MDPFLGSLLAVGFNFAPQGWIKCEGQLLNISQHTALFSLLGTTYGGNGQNTFGIPDLRGRAAIGAGTGPGLSPRSLGEKIGQEDVTLTINQMPAHSHTLALTAKVNTSTTNPTSDEAAGGFLANTAQDFYAGSGSPGSDLGGVSAAGTAANTGGSQQHTNMQPVLVITWLIATSGIYPSPN